MINSTSSTQYYNSSADPSGDNTNAYAYAYAYAIGVSIFALILFISIILISYFCTHGHRQEPSTNTTNRQANSITHHHGSISIEIGIDEATLGSYPKLLYSQAKLHKGDSLASCCPICLGDYKDSDMLRFLPDCGHVFHLQCLDSWLRLHPTCPICRSSPLPTPLPTPLAEVAPLAVRGN